LARNLEIGINMGDTHIYVSYPFDSLVLSGSATRCVRVVVLPLACVDVLIIVIVEDTVKETIESVTVTLLGVLSVDSGEPVFVVNTMDCCEVWTTDDFQDLCRRKEEFISPTVFVVGTTLLEARIVSPPGLPVFPPLWLVAELLIVGRAVRRTSDEVWDETLIEVLLALGIEGPDIEPIVLDSLDVSDIDLKSGQ